MITKVTRFNAWQTHSKWSVNVSSYCYIRCLEIVWEKVTGLIVLTSIPDYEAELKNTRGGRK